jgi:putative DNA primase/helicase
MAKSSATKKIPTFTYSHADGVHTYTFPDVPIHDVRITIEHLIYDKFHRLMGLVTAYIGESTVNTAEINLLKSHDRVDFEADASQLDGDVPWSVYLQAIVPDLRTHVGNGRRPARVPSTAATAPAAPISTSQSASTSTQPLPAIDANNEDLPSIADEAWDALLAANNPPTMFRQGTPIRLEHDHKTGIRAVEVTASRLRYHLARVANFYEEDTKGNREPALPPMWLVDDMLARPDPPLPPLTRIVEVPVFAPDGTLQTTPGYHAASATFLDLPPGLHIPHVPQQPMTNDVALARRVIEEIWVNFPFSSATPFVDMDASAPAVDTVDKANIAHSYALLLLPFVRDLIDDPTPMHLIEASDAGSGKGLLAHALLSVSLGRQIGVLTEAREEDEWRKRLSTVFREMRAAVLLDNLRRPLDSAQLAAALTAWRWDDRRLGTNESIHVPVRCVWVTTGNNPTVSTEMARRTIRIRLDPKMDRPWLRTGFAHPDLLAWVTSTRGYLVHAALVLIQHWLASGKPAPQQTKLLGSYERWATVIGGILESAGIEGFLSNLEAFYELSDHEGTVLREFVARWWEKYHASEVGTSMLLSTAQHTEGLELRGKDEGGQSRSLGKLIAKQRDRVIGDKRVCMARVDHKVNQWKLIDLSPHHASA